MVFPPTLEPSPPAPQRPRVPRCSWSRISQATPGGLPARSFFLRGGGTLRSACAYACRLRRYARAPATGHRQCAWPRCCEGPRVRRGSEPVCGTRPGVDALRGASRLCLRSTQLVSRGGSVSTGLRLRGCPSWKSGTAGADTGFPKGSHSNQARRVP